MQLSSLSLCCKNALLTEFAGFGRVLSCAECEVGSAGEGQIRDKGAIY